MDGKLKIHTYGNKILRCVCQPMEHNERATELANRMLELVRTTPGVSLSANQVGVNGRLFVAELKSQERALVCINPKILSLSEQKECRREGCLSLPEIYANVHRNVFVELAYTDIDGVQKTEKFDEIWARIVLHQMDHLEGRLIIDYLQKQELLLIEHSLNLIECGIYNMPPSYPIKPAREIKGTKKRKVR